MGKTDKNVKVKSSGKIKSKAPLSSKDILATAKLATPSKKTVKTKKSSSSSDEESSEESQSESKPVAQTNGETTLAKKTAATPLPAKDSDSSDESSEDEKPKAAQVKPAVSAAVDSSSDESSESDSDEELKKLTAIKTHAAKATTQMIKASTRKSASATSESSSDDDSSDDKESKNTLVNSKSKAVIPPTPAKTAAKVDTSSDSDDSSSEEAAPNLVASATKKREGDDSSSDNSSSDNEDDDIVMTETATPVTNGKRKAAEPTEAPAKKTKLANGEASLVGTGDEEPSKSIFVGRLSWNVDNKWLAEEFTECGEVVSARVQMDRNTGKSRGFGYVEFTTVEAADAAVLLNGKEIDGRAVNIDKSKPRAPNPEKRAQAFGDTPSEASSTLFVGNISFDTTEDGLWDVFSEYGEVKSVRLPTDRETQRPKGFGYVEFTDIESAKKAFEGAQGLDVGGRNMRLDYSQPRSNDGGDRRGGGRGGFGGDRGGGGRSRGGFGGDRGFGGRGRGGDRGFHGRGGGRGGDRGGRGGRGGFRGGARTGGAVAFEGKKMTFD